MPKKIPMRKCVVTNEQFPKKDLLRIVKTPEGEIVFDATGKRNGHGAYIKKDVEVLELAKKNHALERVFGMEISEEVYKRLEMYLR
ncbi:MAG: YlxR family protein [Solobacterium sp.]|nr:YlxR family protein [Solobacterium sp.]